MQSGVFPLVAKDVNGDLFDQAQGLAIVRLEAFEIGPNNVFSVASGNALRELAHVVGIDLPSDFVGFIGGTANLHGDAVYRTIIWTPDGSGDEGVRLDFGFLGREKGVRMTE